MDAQLIQLPGQASAMQEDWTRIQRVNLSRHAFGLAPFRIEDFGPGAGRPSGAHLAAVNDLLARFGTLIRSNLDQLGRPGRSPVPPKHVTRLKDRGQQVVEAAERIWDHYYMLFSQRQTKLGLRLQATDRIALDCYQKIYTGLGRARSIPTPPPFSFMTSGGGPATWRRGIRVPHLGRLPNPFPIVQLPHHRLLNPWTLGAVAHEVGHNLQSDLGLWQAMPAELQRQIEARGISAGVAKIWARWHSELFSDLVGILFIGPAMAASLIDVMARSPERVTHFDPRGVHPPLLIRIPISLTLVSRLGFRKEARAMAAIWRRLYSRKLIRRLPPELGHAVRPATQAAIEALVYTKYRQFGDRSLSDVVSFGTREAAMTREAASRLAAGTDPGIVPERFLIGASRIAIERRLAPPGRIVTNFYNALERR
ncbi:hypothetical protein [Sulfitobacter sp. JB4-11]|uniref:hypothetical protein n=1 Tax=Sulfitobacter rhodophyticola TaxID=3238304 RepID=UPI00351149FB